MEYVLLIKNEYQRFKGILKEEISKTGRVARYISLSPFINEEDLKGMLI